jgi:hypothetical protein
MLILYDTLLLGLELPPSVNAAINRKIEQYYLVQEYAFRVEREKKESERKQIEADGIKAFQQTVSQGISDSYVRWRGIEATLQLAQSPNTKIVIIGSGKDGLPVILGNVDTPMQPNPAPGSSPGTTPVPDNSEAARQKPAGASPPLLEKTPASNLPTPPERPAPTAVPRAPGSPPASPQYGAPSGPPAGTPPGTPGKQSAAPPTAPPSMWTVKLSDVHDYVSGLMRSEPLPQPSGLPGSRPLQGPGAVAADGPPHAPEAALHPAPGAAPPPPARPGPPLR